jgi:hypothetical protein
MLKAKTVLEAAPEQASVADLAQRYEVHPSVNRIAAALRSLAGSMS